MANCEESKVMAKFRARKSYLMRKKGFSEDEAIRRSEYILDELAKNPSLRLVKKKQSNKANEMGIKEPDSNQLHPNDPLKIANAGTKKTMSKPVKAHQQGENNYLEFIKASEKLSKIKHHNNFTKLRYKFSKLTLYLLIVPMTAGIIKLLLSGLESPLPDTFLAYTIAIVVDWLAIEHFSKAIGCSHNETALFNLLTGCFILIANAAGIYYVICHKSAELQHNVLSETLRNTDRLKVEWITSKWPKASDPYACEEGIIKCGEPFTTSALEKHKVYLASLENLNRLEKSAQNSKTTHSPIWLHCGYFIFAWLLLLMIIRLDNLERGKEPHV